MSLHMNLELEKRDFGNVELLVATSSMLAWGLTGRAHHEAAMPTEQ